MIGWLRFLSNTAAVVLAFFGCLVTQGLAENPRETVVTAALWFLGALVVAVFGAVLKRRAHAARTTTGGEPKLSFEVTADEGWRKQADWALLPDPVPAMPRPRVWTEPKPPQAPMPPDETLRRLWLVRAHLAAFLASSGSSGHPARIMLACLTLTPAIVFIPMGISIGADDPDHYLPTFLMSALFFLATILTAAPVVPIVRATLRRFKALKSEQHRLSEVDSRRPGGPLGGPDLRTSATTDLKRFAYTPSTGAARARFPGGGFPEENLGAHVKQG